MRASPFNQHRFSIRGLYAAGGSSGGAVADTTPITPIATHMAYTEFYADAATGSNMNGGYPIGPGYPASYTNGAWSSVTGVYTVSAGDPTTNTAVGDMVAVFVDGATTPSFVGRCTGRDATTITVSVTIKKGTVPTTAASGISCNVGGAWKGPNAADPWPCNNVSSVALRNAAGDPYRVNYKNGTTYSITAGISHNAGTTETHQGYFSTVGDGGRATIDGGGNAIVLFTSNAVKLTFADLIFSNNGATNVNALTLSGTGVVVFRCVAHDIGGNGFQLTGAHAIECEAYACNVSNTAAIGGFGNSANSTYARCIAHDNVGSNAHGFIQNSTTGILVAYNCISESNGGAGFFTNSTGMISLRNCDIYNNTGAGVDASTTSAHNAILENCNIVKNTGAGVATNAAATNATILINCGYGSGTQANAANSGLGIQEISCGTYATNVTPWNAPTTGDFRITLFAAKDAGRGAFTQTAASYTGTAAALDIGAGQS